MSEMIAIDQLGNAMSERLRMLDSQREATVEAAAKRQKAAAEERVTIEEYLGKIAEVRTEGLLTDKLLANFGHEVAKKRGRPVKTETLNP